MNTETQGMTSRQKMWLIIMMALIINTVIMANSYKDYRVRVVQIELRTKALADMNNMLRVLILKLMSEEHNDPQTLDDILAERGPIIV